MICEMLQPNITLMNRRIMIQGSNIRVEPGGSSWQPARTTVELPVSNINTNSNNAGGRNDKSNNNDNSNNNNNNDNTSNNVYYYYYYY